MPDSLTFLMGNHPAELPGDRLYFRNHMWCQPTASGPLRVGFSSYAVRLMQDVYFLEWRTDPGLVTLKQEIGYIETQKATSGLYAPLPGRILRFNPELLADPSGINADPYGAGWLFEMDADPGEYALDVTGYFVHLEAGWEATQRMLKGQVNSIDDGE
jgi:glycine cleavage system H protein